MDDRGCDLSCSGNDHQWHSMVDAIRSSGYCWGGSDIHNDGGNRIRRN